MRGRHRVDPIQRIHNKTVESGDCILWTGPKTKDGYGVIGIGRGKHFRVHRVVYESKHGPINNGMLICHTCDVPLCINIDHLFIGTPLDNMRDKIAKGRSNTVSGENHPHFKISDAIVEEIMADRLKGRTLVSIAKEYGISFQYVSALSKGVARGNK